MNIQPELRIGDAEREAAVSALGEHFAAGRLTHEEYDERSTLAWAARTGSDLWPLFSDLPRPAAPGRSAGTPLRGRTPRSGRRSDGWSAGSSGGWPQGATRRPAPGGFRIPWLPVLLVVLGLLLVVPGPWWLFLLAAFLFARSLRHGCGGRSRRSATGTGG